jgi:hypothetical protein
MDGLEHMARTKAGKAGPLTTVGWAAALTFVLFGGIGVAASFLAPGLALASTLPTDATGAHPWIVDGGGEIANNVSWRVEIMLEYIALGLAAITMSLRFGKAFLAKLQDWYEGAPLVPKKPSTQPVPAAAIPRPRQGKAANRRKLHAA